MNWFLKLGTKDPEYYALENTMSHSNKCTYTLQEFVEKKTNKKQKYDINKKNIYIKFRYIEQNI